MQWNKVGKYIHNPCKIVNYLGARGGLKFIPDELYLRLRYYAHLENKLNLNYPATFNEKIQWLKLYDRNSIYTQMVDKYEVRQYIASIMGAEYLIPLLGVWDRFTEIDFSALPDQFVLKCTHDSGGVVICKDKSKLNVVDVQKKINRCLKRNYYYYGREWPYKNIKPRIICEKYMIDKSGVELKDYKIMCFNGKAKCSFVCQNRNSPSGLNVDFYDMEWRIMPFERHYPNSGISIPKPGNFKRMVEFAEKISNGIPFLRVDFYEVNGYLYFGELTFYPGSGFEEFIPEAYDYLLGGWIALPKH